MEQKFNPAKVRGLRSENKTTQEEVAKVVGISTNSYISKENGKIDFKAEELVKIANYYNVAISIFFTK